MLLRLETRQNRDDWDALTSMSEPWGKAIEALSQLDASGNPRLADAEAAFGLDTGSPGGMQGRGLAESRRGGGEVQALTLTEVARAAAGLESSPVSVGELFPD